MKMRNFRRLLALFLACLVLTSFLCSCGLLSSPVSPFRRTDKIPILTWHRVVEHSVKEEFYKDNIWVNDLDCFRQNMKYLSDNGYRTLTLDEFYDWYCGKTEYYGEKVVVLTFDDGDIENYTNVLPVLREYGFSATVFLIGNKVKDRVDWDGTSKCYLTRELIDRMQEEYPAFAVESHTYSMHWKNRSHNAAVTFSSKQALQADLDAMKAYDCHYLAYPYGIRSEQMEELLPENGYRLAFGFGQKDLPYRAATRKDNPYYLPRIKVCSKNESPDAFAALLK